MRFRKIKLTRTPASLGRYRMLRHQLQDLNLNRVNLLKKSSKYYKTNGLNSLVYKRAYINFFKVFTHILVKIN